MARLVARPSACPLILDDCRFGTPWRKRTQLVGIQGSVRSWRFGAAANLGSARRDARIRHFAEAI
eukprot:11379080-Heterocapsa_arctica.AAC.1